MGKASLKTKILLSLLAAGSIGVYGFANTAAAAQVVDNYYTGNDTDGVLEITGNLPSEAENVTGVTGRYVTDLITDTEYANNKTVISNGNIASKDIYGFYHSNFADAIFTNNVKIYDNNVTIKNGTINNGNAFGIVGAYVSGNLTGDSEIYNNSIIIEGLENATIYDMAGAYAHSRSSITISNNSVRIENSNITTDPWMTYGIAGGIVVAQSETSKYGESHGTAQENTVEIINSSINMLDGNIMGAYSTDISDKNKVIINNSTINGNVIGAVSTNRVESAGGNPERYPVITTNNSVTVIGKSIINGEIYGAFIEQPKNTGTISGSAINNEIILQGTVDGMSDMSNAILYGSNQAINGTTVANNKLVINNWSGSVLGAYNFSDIDFNNINWDSKNPVLNIIKNGETGALANTNINLNSLNFEGGTQLNAGDTMTFVKGENLGIETGTGKVTVTDEFTAGVARVGSGAVEVDENSVKYTLTEVKQNSQVNLVAENRAVAAAFVNQGTDLISDSLDVLSRDSNYGVKTFAAVHGNKSKYDVNSDIKINGWSVIAGVGNADKFDSGSEFSWGVFYENGSGNYRTYNEFNNEFFRGDGSLVYNGGGIAVRYKNKNGVYTEGSLRAGMLKSDMDNALRDGAGNTYGYESESAYYGAHVGVGKIISLSENSDLDIYGKFFHTYVEGDSFNVAGDKFEFDSINSDRLRVGARVTTNKENKFSTYYGLAYEYEFNGDADMKAQGISAPTQSLQGSSYMAEIGLNYQPTPTSPWSFDLNLRGYTGERQGGSFNVQATYTF